MYADGLPADRPRARILLLTKQRQEAVKEMMVTTWRICGIAAAAASLSGMVENGAAFAPRATSTIRRRAPPALSMERRELVDIALGTVTIGLVGSTREANALDMDSFENSLLENDTAKCDSKDPKCIPKLTADEALCKYGVPGSDARTAACRRVRDAGGLLPTSKTGERSTAGWVDNPIAL
ncbi:hypothetical protein ACHAWF_004982 [Thalassiosira exigua]